MHCPYCGKPVVRVTGEVIYPHRPDLHAKIFYQCKPCDAYVGCHPGTTTPLGRLANAELRAAKMAAHAAFDPIWKNRIVSRSMAYKWLAEKLKLPANECHIGMFDVDMCKQVVEISQRYPL